MFLKKLFGARKREEEEVDPGEEPARFSAPTLPPKSQTNDDLRKRIESAQPRHKGGFDPYNSGSFKRQNAWERVQRK